MEDTGISEEDDDIDSQDSNTPIDHEHLAQNCSIKIIILNVVFFPTYNSSLVYFYPVQPSGLRSS